MGAVTGGLLGYLWGVILATLGQVFILMGPGLILVLAMHFVAGWLDRTATRAMGWKLYYALFSFLGTIIHELGHAFFNLIFGHRITDIKLFNRDPSHGETAHVAFAYNIRSPFQRIGIFFSAAGPILLGTAIIYGLAVLLLGSGVFEPIKRMQDTLFSMDTIQGNLKLFPTVLGGALDILARIFTRANLVRWQFWVFIYLAFSIGSNISLSPADLHGAWSGFITLVIADFVLNLATVLIGLQGLILQFVSLFSGVFYVMMMITLILCLMGGLLMLAIGGLRRMLRRT